MYRTYILSSSLHLLIGVQTSSPQFVTTIDLHGGRLARLRHIKASPQIALIIDEYQEDWRQLWYVLVRGKAKLVPRSAYQERAQAIRQLRAKYPQDAATILPDDSPVIRITPGRVTAWGGI